MRLVQLELKNYRQFKEVSLFLPMGLAGWYGPNGVGKTNLLTSIAWILYGNAAISESKENVRCSLAEPNADVSGRLVFQVNKDGYVIERLFKGAAMRPEAKMWRNNELVAQKADTVTAFVEHLLGMDWRTFYISIFCRQKEINALSSFQPAERRKAILEMLGIHKLDKVVSDIRAEHRDATSKLEAISSKFASVDIANLDKSLAEYQEADNKWKEYIETVTVQINSMSQNMPNPHQPTPEETTLGHEISAINEEIDKLVTIENTVTASMAATMASINQMKAQLQSVVNLGSDGECPTCLGKIGDRHQSVVDDLAAKLKLSQESWDELKGSRDQAMMLKNNMFTQVRSNEAKLREIKDKNSEEFFAINANMRELQAQLADANIKYREVSSTLARLTTMKAEYESSKSSYSEYSDKKQHFSKLEDVMTKFRTYIIGKVSPALSTYASNILDVLSDGKYSQISIDADYNIKIMYDGVEYPIQHFSGGEEDLFNICLRMAISRMIIEQLGNEIGVLFLDEITSALDSSRILSVVNMLSSYAEQIGQIFMITHQHEISDMLNCRMDVREASDGSSTIVLVDGK